MSDKAHRVIAEISSACLLFAAGAAAGMVLLIALFKLGVAGASTFCSIAASCCAASPSP